jgi:hypothetical protein
MLHRRVEIEKQDYKEELIYFICQNILGTGKGKEMC